MRRPLHCVLDPQHQRAEKGSDQSRRGCECPGVRVEPELPLLATLEGAPETAKVPRRAPALPSQAPERWKQVIFQDAFNS